MNEGRPPWWILLILTATLISLGFTCNVHINGPEWIGWTLQRVSDSHPRPAYRIDSIEAGSAAARAGLRPGDLLLESDLRKFSYHEEAGRSYRFEVERAAGGRYPVSIVLSRPGLSYWFSIAASRTAVAMVLAALNLLLAGIIVFARPRDPVARLGALMLAGMSAFALWYGDAKPNGMMTAIRSLPLGAGGFLLIAPTLASMTPAIMITFMGLFPRSTISRGWRRSFWGISLIGIPVAIFGVWAPVYAPDLAFNEPRWLISFYMIGAILFLFAGAGLMARNYFSLKDPNERRRIRVVVTGFLLTITGVALRFAIVLAHQSPQQFQAYPTVTALPWLFIPFSVAMPVSLAYAILRHRVFDIRIMIRQGIQYAAARGVLLSVVPALAVLLALDLLLHGSQPLVEILRQRGWLYGASGVLALLLHSKRHSWLTALDRRFFRERYDAQRVLREVVEEIRAARDLEKAARRVVLQIEATLHSETVAVMLRQPGEAFFRTFACAAAPPPEIPADSKILGLVRLLAKPVEIPQTDRNWLKKQLPHDESQFLKQARIEWLFPILLRAEGAESILALGPKRSEEPYAREDQDLIQAIVAGLALLLERTPVADEPAAGFWECPQCGACYGSGVSRCTNDGMKLALLTLSESLAKRYKIARRLGQGGMGTVYEAHDTELDRSVAVKFIRTERLAGTDAVSRFKREARAAAALSHPNILTIFDYGADEGRNAYIVMELLRGHTLRKELQMHGRLQAKRAGEIMQGVCGAVAAAHRQLLIHRDLKPENIFLVNPGGAEVAKVLDFGLVKPLSTLEETATLSSTAPGMLMGTVRYMSPEQLSGRPPDVSWDLWALALVAYEILVGTYPFDEGHGGHLVHEILAARVISPRVRLQNAPAQWESFFDRALCRDSSLRPSSAAQFAAEFQEIVS